MLDLDVVTNVIISYPLTPLYLHILIKQIAQPWLAMSNWAFHAEFQPRHLKAVNEQIAVQWWQAVQQEDFL